MPQKTTPKQEENLFSRYSPTQSPQDTGSPESQIAQFTQRIRNLTEHFKLHKKDKNSLQRGLKKIVGKRKRLLAYLYNQDPIRYQNICKSLSIKANR